ncbi:PREDICTED: ankyrin repeat and MYND domain-containing protein 1-like [Papilio xuthus]|uniref:Ankyrin repeat and MYND domain-containing protein 1-like n=1 Tax=Papilio xuthus TaxID=66420 RepID=A0AAJ7EGK1_PAPXU|nr:PREDICTED: ankyrin repeat and MYND domain-containing protein 1-like [Papilio xuthus]
MSQHFCGTIKCKSWPYEQYYIGNKDEENRRNGDGENHWTGAKSLERYSGQFLRDTMHGLGEYFWRYIDKEGAFFTYEGHFYCNKLHGYGTLSYPDGRVFNGLFYYNLKLGPGIESCLDIRQNVGLWLGDQLVRLAWIPPTYSMILNLNSTNTGRACVDAQRTLLTTCTKTCNENTAKELLIQYGLDSQTADKKWPKLYPRNCTDITSPVFCLELFDSVYYASTDHNILIENTKKEKVTESTENIEENKTYFSWNNNSIIKHMMQHAFAHDHQRSNFSIKMSSILTDSRKNLKPPAKHEQDCRTLLMASYLGYTEKVVQLINENNIHLDLTDIQGNNVLMYAVCGDHIEIIHFLVDAGANIDNYNDCCCTALCIAIIRYVCAYQNISIRAMTQALIPEASLLPNPALENVCEWYLEKNISSPQKLNGLAKNPSKILKPQKKTKSMMSLKDQFRKTLTNLSVQDTTLDKGDADIENSEDVFMSILDEYVANVAELFSRPTSGSNISYLFAVNDITNEMLDNEMEEQKKTTDKNAKKGTPVPAKVPKSTNDIPQQKDTTGSANFTDRSENEICQRMLSTIVQLLSDGADPNLIKCPQPALFMAVASGSSVLVQHLIDHGANINECYSHVFGYSPIDIVISYQFSMDNLNVIRTLLENGADGTHRLPFKPRDSTEFITPGPTLLHAVLTKAVDGPMEEEIRREIIDLLLTYNCSPIEQFNGRSAIDIAMSKGADVFDVFISHSKVDLNEVINQSKQTILIKMFALSFFKTFEAKERLEILTNLLLRGADPFRPCQNEAEEFDNFFVYARKFLDGLDSSDVKHSPSVSKHEQKVKKNGKSNVDKGVSKQKAIHTDIDEYKLALHLVMDLARLSHVRWLRAKFVNELIKTINKYKHRHWNMILKEITDKTGISLWLTIPDCLEIWTNLSKSIKNDKTVLKYLLCIVFHCCRYINDKTYFDVKVTAHEKATIEKEVRNYIRKHEMVKDLSTVTNYYTAIKEAKDDTIKYNVCFECCLPLKEEKVVCSLCKSVYFCNNECLKSNVDRDDCHPCSYNLKKMYFPNSNSDSNFGSHS